MVLGVGHTNIADYQEFLLDYQRLALWLQHQFSQEYGTKLAPAIFVLHVQLHCQCWFERQMWFNTKKTLTKSQARIGNLRHP